MQVSLVVLKILIYIDLVNYVSYVNQFFIKTIGICSYFVKKIASFFHIFVCKNIRPFPNCIIFSIPSTKMNFPSFSWKKLYNNRLQTAPIRLPIIVPCGISAALALLRLFVLLIIYTKFFFPPLQVLQGLSEFI